MTPDEHDGDALDYSVDGHVVNIRRVGDSIRLAVTPGPIVALTADDAELIGSALIAAARKARSGSQPGFVPPNESEGWRDLDPSDPYWRSVEGWQMREAGDAYKAEDDR
jgi:hypothetical protein